MKIVIDTETIESLVSYSIGLTIILALVLYTGFRYLKNRTLGGIFDQIREDIR